MAYIDRTDVLLVISEKQLAMLEKDNTSLISDLVPTAEDTLTNYLIDLYKVDEEFLLVGEARNNMLVRHSVNIVLYYAYQKVNNDQIPAIKVKEYDDTLADLRRFQRGTINLAGIETQTPDSGRPIRYGNDNSVSDNYNVY
jgi:phage gp36-like protein